VHDKLQVMLCMMERGQRWQFRVDYWRASCCRIIEITIEPHGAGQ
jgi:hypothetical protein